MSPLKRTSRIKIHHRQKKDEQPSTPPSDTDQKARKPSKQLGAQGDGRTQKLTITDYQNHYPKCCIDCKQLIDAGQTIAYAAYPSIDVEWAGPQNLGIHLTNTKHTFSGSTPSALDQ